MENAFETKKKKSIISDDRKYSEELMMPNEKKQNQNFSYASMRSESINSETNEKNELFYHFIYNDVLLQQRKYVEDDI